MPQLSLSLFGSFRAEGAGAPLAGFESDKVRALLAYLAVEAGRPHRRGALAALLWPERPERAALLNLNQALANLRRVVGDREAATPLILSTRESVQLNPAAALELDVAAFVNLLDACATHPHRGANACGPCAARRARAVGLYAGPFLESVTPRDCLPFEEWALVVRERLHQRMLEALAGLAAYHAGRGEHADALVVARRLLELEPWREEAHRQVMLLLWRDGQRAAALAQYERCREVLAAELGADPEQATEELYEAILAGDLPAGTDARTGEPSPQPLHPVTPSPRHPVTPSPLPAPATPFVGREDELAALADRIADPACRLVTVVGLGGSGKTRLAIEAARRAEGFADGVHFVALAAVTRPEELLPAVARALGLAPSGGDGAQAQLEAHLRGRELLLVLDNLEQLRPAAAELAALLEAAPRLIILATSRERLGLRGEWAVELGGLGLPAGSGPGQLERSGAGALFLEAARRARGHAGFDEGARGAVARICHTLGGHPLAIELAASWAHVLAPAAIEGELSHGLALLTGASQDLPERHRTLGAVLDATWEHLAAGEQRALRLLAVFPAGFGREAAEAVLGARPGAAMATLSTLAALMNRALLQREGEGRYVAHAFIRQYAADRLREAGEEEEAHRRLLVYALGLVEAAEAHMKTADEAAWLDRLAAEHAALLASLDRALAAGEAEAAARLCVVLRWFWYIRGYIAEGRRRIECCMDQARAAGVAPALLARLLQGAGVLADEDGDYAGAAARYEEALTIFGRLGDKNGVRIVTNSLGVLHNSRGHYGEAQICFEVCLHLSRELGNSYGIATSLNNLGTTAMARGELPAALAHFAEGLEGARAIGYTVLTATLLDNLGDAALAMGELQRARAAYGEALALQRAEGDTQGAALSLRGLGLVALAQGDPAAAAGPIADALGLMLAAMGRRELIVTLDAVAALLAARGLPAEAARLCGAADAGREGIGTPATPLERRAHELAVGACRAALGAGAFEVAWGAGRATSPERAAEEALRLLRA